MADAEDGRVGTNFKIETQTLVDLIESREGIELGKLGGVEGICEKLQTSPEHGLSGDETRGNGLKVRRDVFGPNQFKYPPPKSFLKLCLLAFKDLTVIILTMAAVLSLVINLAVQEYRDHYGYLEGIAIVLVVIIVVLVQASIDYSKEKKFRQLNSVKDNYDVQTIRAGSMTAVPSTELVVGDVMKISAGDKLAADAIVISASRLKTNEAAMTGEPIDIEKTREGDAFLLSGTTVSEGTGTAVVVAVGSNSQWGVILSRLVVEPEDTPLQVRLNRLALNIGKLGIIMATLTFLVSMIRWIVESARSGDWSTAVKILEFFIDSVTIVVVAVPEGLPLAITLGLAFAMRKMMADNNLVRRLEACETMGSATQLNADKTGTLTQNRMTVVEAFWAGKHTNYGVDESADSYLSPAFKEMASINMAVNTQANLEFGENGIVEHLGNKTECALIQHIQRWNYEYKVLRDANPSKRIYLFDSNKKRMSTTQELSPGHIRVYCKGAPEIVVQLCDFSLNAEGKTEPLSEAGRSQVLKNVEAMAGRGLRTLLICYVDVEHSNDDEAFWSCAPEQNMILVGVVGIKDPVRPETAEAVRLLKGAGVTVRMVTGDNVLTAKFIAKEAGILDDEYEEGAVMEGKKFRQMSEAERAEVALPLRVLARSSPNDKLLLVQSHKRLGEVVSVTGDGTNDAPALKEADVGFALGLAGTEIAKEASDIIILDDNISSMAKAVLWGRNVYDSIRKFLQFQLVVNIVAVSLNFISACAGKPLPLGAVPLLWVNMIMDSMGALALATEPPRRELMKRKPFGRRAPLINRAMMRNIVGISLYQLVVCLILQYAGTRIFNIDCTDAEQCELEISSVIFNTFVFMQVFNEISSRRIDEFNVFQDIFKSYYFMAIIAITIVVQVLIMLLLGGTNVGDAIGIGKITGVQWAVSLIIGLITLPLGMLLRLWPLEWCIGPMDDDPLEQSKLEKFLHLPKRKPMKLPEYEEMESAIDEVKIQVDGENSKTSSRILRMRVFVHAVAFINVVKRAADSKHEARITYEKVAQDKLAFIEETDRNMVRHRFRASIFAVFFH